MFDKLLISGFMSCMLILAFILNHHSTVLSFEKVILCFVYASLFFVASGSSRRPWVLGKVMEKEYCQAKKVN